ncbi:hypothetical protein L6452_35242 [Arctium lappa]|uniref:Uncharacterized protein n=1 Tax=Arctium lappa TaxID=4217 RepID=A0ACB8Y5X6_ARCLA|nr:hypothetical protein L6452_35242 [Arctium lappa]
MPLKRLGTTEDMAVVTAFLASNEASYIAGETTVVVGGMDDPIRKDHDWELLLDKEFRYLRTVIVTKLPCPFAY